MLHALAKADQAVSAAEDAVRAAGKKQVSCLSPGIGNLGNAIRSSRTYEGQKPFVSRPALEDVDEQVVATEVPAADLKGSGESFLWGSPPRPVGFMASSKVAVAVERLLQTGGGRPDVLDVAKGLVLRGCLQQKLGRRKSAGEDYHRALEVCRRQIKCLGHPKRCKEGPIHGERGAKADRHGENLCHGSRTGKQQLNIEKGGTQGQSKVSKSKNHRRSDLETNCSGDNTKNGLPLDENFKHAPPPSGAQTSDDNSNSSRKAMSTSKYRDGRWSDYCKVLQLESLVHHNLATLHMAAALDGDVGSSFHKVCSISFSSNNVVLCLRGNTSIPCSVSSLKEDTAHGARFPQ